MLMKTLSFTKKLCPRGLRLWVFVLEKEPLRKIYKSGLKYDYSQHLWVCDMVIINWLLFTCPGLSFKDSFFMMWTILKVLTARSPEKSNFVCFLMILLKKKTTHIYLALSSEPNWKQLYKVCYVVSFISVPGGLQKFESVPLFLGSNKTRFLTANNIHHSLC